MPEPLLPQFPTQFTPEDEERLKQLEEQRKALSQAWGVKFSEKAWARTPSIEKLARKAAPSFLTSTIGILPGTAETMEFGFTPEQFRKSIRDTEEEFKDISRRRKVTELLPNIQSDIILSAISGDPIKDMTDLESTFPELKYDFTGEEKDYLARVADAASRASPEQLMSGEIFAYEPNQLPVTMEDVYAQMRRGVDPRYIFATIEFAKGLEDVTAALTQAYPSQVPEDEATKAMRDRFRDYFRQRNEELGISPPGAQPTKQAIQDIHTRIAEEEGELLTLTDDMGGVASARRKSDGTVWIGDELLGYAKEDGSIVGFNLQGQPLVTPEMEESAIKDLWDAWYLAGNRGGMGIEKAITQIIPDAFLAIAEKTAPYTVLGDKRAKEASLVTINAWREKLKARYEQSTLEFNEWLTKHPEFNPRPEWSKPVESPRDFLNPGRIAYIIASNTPMLVAALSTGFLTGVATGGNLMAGAVAASAVMTPVMISDVVDDAVDNGASFEDATTLSTVVGVAMGAVEILPFGIVLRTLYPAFMTAFKGSLQKGLTRELVKNLTIKGILGKAAKNTLTILAAEEAEEAIQQVMQNSVVKVFNESRNLLDNVGQTALDTFWAVLPLAMTGGAATYYNMKPFLPEDTRKRIDETATELKKAGLEPDHAEAVALSQLVEDEVGQAQVEEAMEQAAIQVTPVTPEVTEPGVLPQTTFLENKLSSYNEEMSREISTIEAHKKRLEGMSLSLEERLDEEDSIKRAQDRLDTLTRDKKALTKKIKKAKEKPPEPELTLEEMEFNELIKQNPTANIRRISTPPYKYEVIKNNQRLSLVNLEQARELIEDDVIISFPERVKVEDVTPVKEEEHIGFKIAAEIGATFDGVSKGTMWFTDKETGSPFMANTLEEAKTRITEMRAKFKAAEVDLGVTPIPETQEVLSEIAEISRDIIKDSPLKRLLIPDLTYNPSEGLPMLPDLSVDLNRMAMALDSKSDLKKLLKLNKKVEANREIAKTVISRLQTELNNVVKEQNSLKNKRGIAEKARRSEVKETIKEKTKTLKDIAKKAKLSDKALMVVPWDMLLPDEQLSVAVSQVPDHSLVSGFGSRGEGVISEFKDTSLLFSGLQGESGKPFLAYHDRLVKTAAYAKRLADEYLKPFLTNPKWVKVIKNTSLHERIALIIDSRRPGSTSKVDPPTTEEDYTCIEIADAMEAVYKKWQPVIRYMDFMESYEDNPSVPSIMEKIPDAPEADIIEAKRIFEVEGEDELWQFLGTKKWGVYESGYTPYKISKPDLKTIKPKWTSTVGKSYLMTRETNELPYESRHGLFAIFHSYNRTIAMRFFLRKEMESFADDFYLTFDKWDNPKALQNYLRKYFRALQGFPEEEGEMFGAMIRKMQRWARPVIFMHPFAGIRNRIQSWWSHPYREEIVRMLWEYKKLPSDVRAINDEHFAFEIDQTGAIKTDFLYQGETIDVVVGKPAAYKEVLGKLGYITKPLDFLSAQAAKIPTMAFTDKVTRSETYYSMFNKAWRATEQYKAGKSVKWWFDNSGINSGYITNEQINGILGLLTLGEAKVSWGVPGMQSISGYQAAAMKIAQETTNRTLYLYNTAQGGGIQRGAFGKTFGSLLTFTRSTAQMYAMQVARVVGKESTVGERITATKNLALLWLWGEMLGQFLMLATGRRSKEYSFINTLTWQFGGLALGLVGDVFSLFNDIVTATTGMEDEKEKAIERAIQATPRVFDAFVGFYRISMDAAESIFREEPGWDKRWLRQVRAMIDSKYTPEQQEKAERNAVEIVQKIVFGAEPPEPDVFENVQQTLVDEEIEFGKIIMGRPYTLAQFGGKIEQLLSLIPDYLITEDAGFSDLVMFYARSRDAWQEYYITPTESRADWRKAHPEEEAMLLFWGKVSKSVFSRYSPTGREVANTLKIWYELYGITRNQLPAANWSSGGEWQTE